jgi:hypothetical protein
VFVAGVQNTTGRVVFCTVRCAQPRNDLLGPGGVVAILAFVAVTVGVSLAVTAVIVVVGGPQLMRYPQGLMLANRTGRRR